MAAPSIEDQVARCANWPEKFQPDEWKLYKAVLHRVRERGIPFAVGGGLAAMTYAGQWRDTKDLDLYILKRDCEALQGILAELGLRDYYEKQPYDRKWIYRAYKEDIIIDLMWAMANQRAQVDESWMVGPEVTVEGERMRLLAPEEALWSKLYVLQRERSDWPDTLNLLYGVGPDLDFRRLLRNLGEDTPLLGSVLNVFGWLCPARAREFPAWLWAELKIEHPGDDIRPELTQERARLLDTRPWFTPTISSS